jgi:MFS family permease
MWGLSRDAKLLVTAQGLRAAGYGFTAIVLGALMAGRGYGPPRVGLVLSALVAGTAITSLLVGAFADRFGRRRCYGLFFIGVAVSGALVASGAPFWLLLVVAVTGTVSTDVVDNGPATTLEQVMLAREDAGTATVYGAYNAIGAAGGAAGALALSQMDVPTRQALVMTVVTPTERSPAAAVTNAARYTVRPLGPLLAAAVQTVGLGAPLVVAGVTKAAYDIALWRWARRVRLPGRAPSTVVGPESRPDPSPTVAAAEEPS